MSQGRTANTETSSESLQPQDADEQDVSWPYEPSGYGDLDLEIPNAVPRPVRIPDTSSQAYSATYCFRICKPKAGFYKEATAIRAYRNLLQTEYDAVFKLMDWIELPGGEHQKVKGNNYLSCQLWLYSFAAVQIDEEEKQLEHLFSEHYEEAMAGAEETGMTLRHYLKPLGKITEACKVFENMSNLIDPRMHVPGLRNVSGRSGEGDVIQQAILKGNQIDDFSKLHIYCRDQMKMQWSEFRVLTLQNQLSNLTKGLDQFIQKLRTIRILLDKPLEILKKADSNLFTKGPTLISHIKKMHKYLKKIVTHEEINQSDEQIIKDIFLESNTHALYIVQTGRNLVTKVWEIVLMTRLCYSYVRESSNTHIHLISYESIINRKFKTDVNRLLKPTLYNHDDFFRAPCPDVLRKVPIVIQRKLELALHYEGHRNTVKSPGGRSIASIVMSRRKSLQQSTDNSFIVQNLRKTGLLTTTLGGQQTPPRITMSSSR